MRLEKLAIGLLAWGGCGPAVSLPDQQDTGSTGSTASADATTVDSATTVGTSQTTTPGTSVGTSVGTLMTSASDTSDSTDVTNDGSAFFPGADDGGSSIFECDQFTQDCPRGEKCMPWANDGGSSWNGSRCAPLDPNPQQPGEPCMVEGSGFSGIDNCELGSMCFDVDPETNSGECVAFCQGNEANPFCADACSQCAIGGDSVLILCIPECDPVAQDCDPGEGCYPINDSFGCVVDAGGDSGTIGEACEFVNVCDPGSLCAPTENVPGCADATGCCTPFCNVDVVDNCDALVPGTSCVPWFDDGQRPDGCGSGTIGACLLPI